MRRVWTFSLAVFTAAVLAILWRREQAVQLRLEEQMAALDRQNTGLRHDLAASTQRAAELEKRAVALDNQLGSAKTRTTATESKHIQLARELNETKSQLTEREQREVALMTELATLREKLAGATTAAVGAPASATPSLPVEPSPPAVDVQSYERRISDLERQLTELLTRALAEPVQPPAVEPAPHQVVRVGPHDSFVVLDYGRQQGARPGDIVRLQRGTSELARVQISDARPGFSLAQVLPATLKGQLQTGDLVVLEN